MNILSLPLECLCQVMSHLQEEDHKSTLNVCRAFRAATLLASCKQLQKESAKVTGDARLKRVLCLVQSRLTLIREFPDSDALYALYRTQVILNEAKQETENIVQSHNAIRALFHQIV